MAAALALMSIVPVACTGDAQTPSSEGRGARDRAVDIAAGDHARRAKMQAGTDWVDGVLASFCSEGTCTADEHARPRRELKAADSGLLLFVVPSRPSSTRVEIAKLRGRIVVDTLLAPSTTMPMRALLRSGRYVVSLIGEWDSHEARWVFGLRVDA